MGKLDEFCDIAREFHEAADFLIVYQEEAHASNGWGFASSRHKVMQHRTLKDRIVAAEYMLEQTNVPCPVLVDQMTNEASSAYGGMPERLYVILNDKIVYQGGVGPMDYRVQEVRDWLSSR